MKEISANTLATMGHAGRFDSPLSLADDTRQVEDHPMHSRIRIQDRGHESAVSPTHIHELAQTAEIIRCEYRHTVHRNEPGHRFVEYRRVVGMSLKVLEVVHPVDAPEASPAGLSHLQHSAPR